MFLPELLCLMFEMCFILIDHYVFSSIVHTKKLIESFRVCHNHRLQLQPTLDTQRKRKRTKTYVRKINKQMYEKHKTCSLFPKRGDQNPKTNGETRTKSTRRLKTLSTTWYKPQSYTELRIKWSRAYLLSHLL